MTEPTTEEQIATMAKDRVKKILENGDFWGSPGASKTSAEAIGTLLSYRWQLESVFAPLETEETPAAVVKEKRTSKAKEQAAATVEANDTETADA